MLSKLVQKQARRLLKRYQRFRIAYFKLVSCAKFDSSVVLNQPVYCVGPGHVTVGAETMLGYYPSPHYYSGYCHFDTRTPEANIHLGERLGVNNNLTIISEGPGVWVGSDTLIGTNVQIVDSDFHGLAPNKRAEPERAPVHIGENCFLGSNVIVLKGVTLGDHCVVGAGSVVTKSFPPYSLIGGNPAKLIRRLEPDEELIGA